MEKEVTEFTEEDAAEALKLLADIDAVLFLVPDGLCKCVDFIWAVLSVAEPRKILRKGSLKAGQAAHYEVDQPCILRVRSSHYLPVELTLTEDVHLVAFPFIPDPVYEGGLKCSCGVFQ